MIPTIGRLVAVGRSDVALESPANIRRVIQSIRPNIIVNAAAYTAVDGAEHEPDVAYAVNAIAPRVMAEEASALNALLIHYSTDYVFDGTSRLPYMEDDRKNPINTYGRTKLAGENAICNTGVAHVIFRTSWVYGARGNNFLKTMLRLARERSELRIVCDQVGSPTSSRAIAQATTRVLASVLADGKLVVPEELWGVYNLTASDETSWYGFACEILALDPRRIEQICREVIAVESDAYPTDARRPSYSVLNNGKIKSVFGVSLPSWKSQMADVMTQLG